MSKVLSQDEVDALLKGVQTGDIEAEKRSGGDSGAKPFDLASQERIIRGKMPGLEMINERFSRLFRNSISSKIMKYVEITIPGVEMMKFSELIRTVPMPSSINILKLAPLKGHALLVIEAPMVFAFIEFFFGGNSAKHVKTEGRYFTPIEQNIIKKIVSMTLNDMAEAWREIIPIIPEHIGSEMNPQFVTIMTPSEVIMKIEVQIGVEDFTGKLFFCIPYSMIEPIREKLSSGIQVEKYESDQRWLSRLREIVMESDVEISAEIGTTALSVRDIMSLEIGNIITLGKSVSDDLKVLVENVPKFLGTPGYSRGAQAVKITKNL